MYVYTQVPTPWVTYVYDDVTYVYDDVTYVGSNALGKSRVSPARRFRPEYALPHLRLLVPYE